MFAFIHQARREYGEPIYDLIKEYTKISKQIEKRSLGIEFIHKCLNSGKLPKFSRLNVAYSSTKPYADRTRLNITEIEMERKIKSKRSLVKSLNKLKATLSEKLNTEMFFKLEELINSMREGTRVRTEPIHQKKLRDIGIPIGYVTLTQNVNKRRGKVDKAGFLDDVKTIYNLSSRTLNSAEERVLSRGLKYGICNKKVDTYELLARFEELAQSLHKLEINNNEQELKASLNSTNNFLQKLQAMSFEFISLANQSVDNLNEKEHQALNNLAKDKTIVLSKADKGNAVVIQDRTEYLEKMHSILNTNGKFNKLNGDCTRSRENRLQNYLRTIKNKDRMQVITEEVYKRILPCGSKAGVLYGLPKIHKKENPLRPIISAVKTYNYDLAKYLVKILTPLIKGNAQVIKDTYDFVNKVSRLNLGEDKYIVSFDVESLFTNIPTIETIEITLKLAFPRNTKFFHGISKSELRKLLTICTQESHFQFDGEFIHVRL